MRCLGSAENGHRHPTPTNVPITRLIAGGAQQSGAGQTGPAGSVEKDPKRPSRPLSLDFNDHLDLNSIIEWKSRHSRRQSVRAFQSSGRKHPPLNRKSVYYLWLVTKIVGRVDHP